jgi:hypothetical protein
MSVSRLASGQARVAGRWIVRAFAILSEVVVERADRFIEKCAAARTAAEWIVRDPVDIIISRPQERDKAVPTLVAHVVHRPHGVCYAFGVKAGTDVVPHFDIIAWTDRIGAAGISRTVTAGDVVFRFMKDRQKDLLLPSALILSAIASMRASTAALLSKLVSVGEWYR